MNENYRYYSVVYKTNQSRNNPEVEIVGGKDKIDAVNSLLNYLYSKSIVLIKIEKITTNRFTKQYEKIQKFRKKHLY